MGLSAGMIKVIKEAIESGQMNKLTAGLIRDNLDDLSTNLEPTLVEKGVKMAQDLIETSTPSVPPKTAQKAAQGISEGLEDKVKKGRGRPVGSGTAADIRDDAHLELGGELGKGKSKRIDEQATAAYMGALDEGPKKTGRERPGKVDEVLKGGKYKKEIAEAALEERVLANRAAGKTNAPTAKDKEIEDALREVDEKLSLEGKVVRRKDAMSKATDEDKAAARKKLEARLAERKAATASRDEAKSTALVPTERVVDPKDVTPWVPEPEDVLTRRTPGAPSPQYIVSRGKTVGSKAPETPTEALTISGRKVKPAAISIGREEKIPLATMRTWETTDDVVDTLIPTNALGRPRPRVVSEDVPLALPPHQASPGKTGPLALPPSPVSSWKPESLPTTPYEAKQSAEVNQRAKQLLNLLKEKKFPEAAVEQAKIEEFVSKLPESSPARVNAQRFLRIAPKAAAVVGGILVAEEAMTPPVQKAAAEEAPQELPPAKPGAEIGLGGPTEPPPQPKAPAKAVPPATPKAATSKASALETFMKKLAERGVSDDSDIMTKLGELSNDIKAISASYEKRMQEAQDQYAQDKARTEWAEVAETIGNALTQFGAAWYGMDRNVDAVSGIKLSKTDWGSKLDRYLAELKMKTDKLETGLATELAAKKAEVDAQKDVLGERRKERMADDRFQMQLATAIDSNDMKQAQLLLQERQLQSLQDHRQATLDLQRRAQDERERSNMARESANYLRNKNKVKLTPGTAEWKMAKEAEAADIILDKTGSKLNTILTVLTRPTKEGFGTPTQRVDTLETYNAIAPLLGMSQEELTELRDDVWLGSDTPAAKAARVREKLSEKLNNLDAAGAARVQNAKRFYDAAMTTRDTDEEVDNDAEELGAIGE